MYTIRYAGKDVSLYTDAYFDTNLSYSWAMKNLVRTDVYDHFQKIENNDEIKIIFRSHDQKNYDENTDIDTLIKLYCYSKRDDNNLLECIKLMKNNLFWLNENGHNNDELTCALVVKCPEKKTFSFLHLKFILSKKGLMCMSKKTIIIQITSYEFNIELH